MAFLNFVIKITNLPYNYFIRLTVSVRTNLISFDRFEVSDYLPPPTEKSSPLSLFQVVLEVVY